VDVGAAAGAFQEVATVSAQAGMASATLTALAPGRSYEWYAEASDCVHRVRSPLYTFVTAP
jgi:hypothetical protein